jgi:hypothetical protein
VGERLLCVPLVVDEGRFHAIVTVTGDDGDGILDANLGVARTSKPFEADERGGATPMLDAADVAVELVRWKSVLAVDTAADTNALAAEAEGNEAEAAGETAKKRAGLTGQIQQWETRRQTAIEEVQGWRSKIATKEAQVRKKNEQIAAEKRRHRFPDISALLTARNKLLHEIAGLKGHIATHEGKIKKYGAELNGLRRRLAELDG